MIADLSSLGPRGDVACDVCIVGAGAAGVTLARELQGSGLDVCLVESGGPEVEPASEALSEGDSVGRPIALVEGRARAFGGSSWKWTGRCAVLDPLDFEPRPWVRRSGWPIDHAALAPYYRRAEPYCGFEAPWTDDEASPAGETTPGSPLAPFLWRYAPQGKRVYVNFGKTQRRALEEAADVRVFLHAHLTAFEVAAGRDRVEAIVVRALGGAAARITARAFALSCGGIANPVLLLHGARSTGAAFGDGGGQVGRCFQQHPRGVIATVEADAAQSARLQRNFNIFAARRGLQREVGWALTPQLQRAERLLNASVIAVYHADPRSGWQSAKAVLSDVRAGRLAPDLGAKLARIAADAGVAKNALRRAAGRHAILETERIDLVVDVEQEPDPESRIVLSDRTDRFGVPLPRVDWRISELERRTSARFAALLQTEIESRGLGRVVLQDWLDPARPLAEARLVETYHHLGATRMSADASSGVVDADCKVHGMANLYVAGGSVFPTGGHANPTFTIVALALRLADRLKATLAR
jgi:choline dehydrogenase-like flavoprotein